MMPGVQFQEVARALTEAFTNRELAEMLRSRPDLRLEEVVAGKPSCQVVADLLTWAVCQDQEVPLLHAAYRTKPCNPKIREIYQKYGMAPHASVQQAGVPVPNAPKTVMAEGFEKAVNRLIPSFDLDAWRKKIGCVEGWVCRIKLDQEPMGTGFLVGPDMLVTNYHVLRPVIEGGLPWSVVACQFDYRILTDGSRYDGMEVGVASDDCLIDSSAYSPAEGKGRPASELPTPDELDYAVVRLERPVGIESLDRQVRTDAMARGWAPVPADGPALRPDQPLLIMQHPYSKPLTLALDMQGVIGLNANGTRVRYATHLEPGASGSPCFTLDWTLAALHHYGDPLFGHPCCSQGVPIGMIRDRLVRLGKADALGGTPP
jgi:hypothetical protein